MNGLLDLLLENPVIGAIRTDEDLEKVIRSNVELVFVLFGSLTSIGSIAGTLKKHGKRFFIHIDMIDGLKSDESGIQFLKEVSDPSGIITTKHTLVKPAKKLSLYTILRIFIIDSKSLTTGLMSIEKYSPDAIEVMPGVSGRIIKMVGENVRIPIIAGGLIETKEEVFKALNAGAVSISTTKREVWNI